MDPSPKTGKVKENDLDLFLLSWVKDYYSSFAIDIHIIWQKAFIVFG